MSEPSKIVWTAIIYKIIKQFYFENLWQQSNNFFTSFSLTKTSAFPLFSTSSFTAVHWFIMLVILMSYYSKGKGRQIIDKTRVHINKRVSLKINTCGWPFIVRCTRMTSRKIEVYRHGWEWKRYMWNFLMMHD